MNYKFLPVKLKLNSPLLLTSHSGDPNSANTLSFIPGNSIRGAFAAKITQTSAINQDEKDNLLKEFILSDDVCFLNAYPAIENNRTVPFPICFRRKKKSVDLKTVYHLKKHNWEYEENGEIFNDQPKALGELFLDISDSDGEFKRVDYTVKMHNQRDREKGKAYKENDVTVGAVYSYEAIKEGQEFIAQIKIVANSPEQLEIRTKKVKEIFGNQMLLGRSKKAGYGGEVSLTFLPEKNSEISSKYGKLKTFPANEDIQEHQTFHVLLTSDYCGKNLETGFNDPNYFFSDLKNSLNGQIELQNQFCSYDRVGGFNRKWKTRIPQMPVLKAGSIFSFKTNCKITHDEWKNLECSGLGLRKNEGFGRFLFLKDEIPEIFSIREAVEKAARQPEGEIPAEVLNLDKEILKNALLKNIDFEVLQIVTNKNCKNIAPNSLLAKIRSFARRNPENAISILNEQICVKSHKNSFKEKALNNLRDFKIEYLGKKNFLDLITELINDNDRLFTKLSAGLSKQTIACKNEQEVKDKFLESLRNLVKVEFIDRLISALILKNTKGEDK